MAAATQLAPPKPPILSPSALQRLQAFWAGRTPQQRMFLGIGLAITLAAAALFIHFVSTPDMKPLMSGLQADEVKAVAAELDAKKIAYVIGPDGATISVAADQVDAARLEVASHDNAHGGRIGFEIFDKTSWGETEFDEKVNYQRALEGELERTISTMRNVKSTSVHLVMSTDSVFLDRQRSAKASVTLRVKGDGLKNEEVKAVQRLVAGSVDELKPADVTIIDADSERTLSSAGTELSGGDGELEQDLTKRLMATLAPVVGADRLHASVNVEYETSSSEETQDKYDPQGAVPLSMQKTEEQTAGGLGVGGVPGTSSNVPSSRAASATPTAAADPTQSSKSESASYGVDRLTRHSLSPAGGIRRLTAAVVVDDVLQRHQEKGKWVETHVKRTPEELKLITGLAEAAIGYNQARGDVVAVQNLAFDRPETVESAPPTLAEKTQKQINNYATLIRYGVLLVMFTLVYLLTVRPLQMRALALPKDEEAPNVEVREEHALPAPAGEIAALPKVNTAERTLALKQEVTEFIQQEPDASVLAVRAWLRES